MLANFGSFVAPLDDALLTKVPLNDSDGFNYKLKEDYINIIRIPEGTSARHYSKRKEFYEVKIHYDIWPMLISRWEQVIEFSEDKHNSEATLQYCKNELECICRFVSKLIIIDPSKIEDISLAYSDVSIVRNNLEKVTGMFLKSIEQLKMILLFLKEDSEYVNKMTLNTIGSIISAISSLYTQPQYRNTVTECLSHFEKSIDDFDKPYTNIYTNHGSSNNNKLNHMLKDLNNIEFSLGEYPVTKAITKLGAVIMSDPLPSHYLMNLLYCIKDMKFKHKKENLSIQLHMLETFKHALLKFTTSLTKSNMELKNLQSDGFVGSMKDYLNDADIEKVIEEALELVVNQNTGIRNSKIDLSSHRLVHINKMFSNYQEDISSKQLDTIKDVIATSLECIQIILNLVYTQLILEKDNSLKSKSTFLHQHHIGQLSVVQYIKDALLSNISFMTDLDDNKLLLTIASYVRFENSYLYPINTRTSDTNRVVSSTVSYERHINVSSIALNCMTEIVRIWELFPVSKRPSLASYLTHENNTFAGSHKIISNCNMNVEETYCFIQFLVCCTNSQIGFLNALFKDPNYFKAIIDVFCKHSDKIVRRARHDRELKRVVGILVILVSNLIQNNKIKSNKDAKDMIKQFLGVYISNSRDTLFALFVDRTEFSQNDFDFSNNKYDLRRQADKMLILQRDEELEQRVKDICLYNHVISSYLLIISNLLVTVDKDPEIKKLALKGLSAIYGDQLLEMLKICTTSRLTSTGDVMKDFTETLAKLGDHNQLDYNISHENMGVHMAVSDKEDLLIPIEQLQFVTSNSVPKEQSEVWKQAGQSNFRKNLFGYGRSYVVDRNELYYMLKN